MRKAQNRTKISRLVDSISVALISEAAIVDNAHIWISRQNTLRIPSKAALRSGFITFDNQVLNSAVAVWLIVLFFRVTV